MGRALPYPLYEDKLPTIFLKNIIETGAEIISSSNKNNEGKLVPSSSVSHIYNKNPKLFEDFHFCRTRQHDRKGVIDPLFENLVRACIENYQSL